MPTSDCWCLFILLFLHFSTSTDFKFVALFIRNCEAYKVETRQARGQWVGVACIQESDCYCIFISLYFYFSFSPILFFFFFLSLKLAKIKKFHLQNCFNIPLMAMAGGIWAMHTTRYIYYYIDPDYCYKCFCCCYFYYYCCCRCIYYFSLSSLYYYYFEIHEAYKSNIHNVAKMLINLRISAVWCSITMYSFCRF